MEIDKVSKKKSGYEVIDPKLSTGQTTIGQRCDTCFSFQNPNKCTLVKGFIANDASCILWSHDAAPILPNWLSGAEAEIKIKLGKKLTKVEAGYLCALPPKLRSPKDKGFRCGNCEFFHPSNGNLGTCGIVKGSVHEQACCNLFKSEPKKQFHYSFSSAKELGSVLHLKVLPDIEDLGCK